MKLHNGRLQKDKEFKVKPNLHEGQFNYLGRWVDKHNFRAFVYDKDGKEKLANTYEDFQILTTSGIWFASKEIAKEIAEITKATETTEVTEAIEAKDISRKEQRKEPQKEHSAAVISLKGRKKKDGTICTTS